MSQSTNTYVTYDDNMIGSGNQNDPFSQLGCPLGGAILQPRKASFSPTTLGSTDKTYTSADITDITNIAVWSANKDFSYKCDELPGGVYTITITVPYDEINGTDDKITEVNIQKWEIKENVTSRDIFDIGIFIAQNPSNPNGPLTTLRYTVPSFMRPIIKQGIKYGNFGQLNFSQLKGTTLTAAQLTEVSKLASISQQFYYLLLGGTTSVKAATQHVQRNIVYSLTDPNAYDNDPYFQTILTDNSNSFGNISSVISGVDLVRIFGMDATDASQLFPSYSRCKSLNGPSQFSDPVTSFAFAGYLMHTPTKTLLTPTKIQLSQLFEWDEWLDVCYPIYSHSSQFPLIQPTPYPPYFNINNLG